MAYNICEYGAVGDGHTNDSSAIQAAIDACTAAGGGRVLVPGGKTYCTGSVVLKSGVELHLEKGALLLASPDTHDYAMMPAARADYTEPERPVYENCEYNGQPAQYFILCRDAESVSITGRGTIDGNEHIYYGKQSPDSIEGAWYPRIPLLFLEHVEHLSICDVTLQNSGFWTTHMVGCNDVLIDRVHILNNRRMMNCDGIDPDHCTNVRISNCYIQSADDCIVFKNTAGGHQYGPCSNICVTNCTLASTSAAIKFGTESEGEFSNITVSNCNIIDSNRGISLQLRDCGFIHNILFSNITIETKRFSGHWWGEAEAISVTAVDRRNDVKCGYIDGVTFQNITCSGENGIFIYGCSPENRNIRNLTFQNVSVELRSVTEYPKTKHDIRPCEGDGILPGTLNAVYCRHAENVTFDRLHISVCDDAKQWVKQDIDVAETTAFSQG